MKTGLAIAAVLLAVVGYAIWMVIAEGRDVRDANRSS